LYIYITFVIQCFQAWCTLINLSINNTYLRPGITPAIDNDSTSRTSSTKGSTFKVTSNADGSFCAHNHPEHSQRSVRGTAKSIDSFSSSSVGDNKIIIDKVPRVNYEVRDSVTVTNGMEMPPIKNSAQLARPVEPREVSLGEIDYDDIMEVIFFIQLGKIFKIISTFSMRTRNFFSIRICSTSKM